MIDTKVIDLKKKILCSFNNKPYFVLRNEVYF